VGQGGPAIELGGNFRCSRRQSLGLFPGAYDPRPGAHFRATASFVPRTMQHAWGVRRAVIKLPLTRPDYIPFLHLSEMQEWNSFN
jgi:hypothetical protein